MDFSSIPGYFDASNWHQQNHQIVGEGSAHNHLQAPAAQPPPPPLPHGGAIRPGSMAERPRMANIPMPEAALKCPRCESINTKFCYYNNYSRSQPRHFCKTCRRYWTKGGALRNVPVGGGCRRNKRSKSRSSMSPASTDRQTNTSSINTTSTTNSGSGIIGLTSQLPQLRFMSPLSQLSDTFTGDMALSYTGISAPVVGVSNEMSFHGMSNVLGSTSEVASLFSNGNGSNDSWRLNQPLSFLGGLEMPPNPGMFRFPDGGPSFMGLETSADQVRPKLSTLNSQNLTIKLEDNRPQPNLSRQIISGIQGNDHWNANPTWNELSGFSSSSTNNLL